MAESRQNPLRCSAPETLEGSDADPGILPPALLNPFPSTSVNEARS